MIIDQNCISRVIHDVTARVFSVRSSTYCPFLLVSFLNGLIQLFLDWKAIQMDPYLSYHLFHYSPLWYHLGHHLRLLRVLIKITWCPNCSD